MDPQSPNVVEGGKRPFHTIITGFLSKDGKPVMSFGVMGGDMQPQGHWQTVIRMNDYDQKPQAACCAPRWKVNRDLPLDLEHTTAPAGVKGLPKRQAHVVGKESMEWLKFSGG